MQPDGPPSETQRFPWSDAPDQLDGLLALAAWEPATDGRRFHGVERDSGVAVSLEVPWLLGPPEPEETLAAYRDRMDLTPGHHGLLLFQAGAAAMGRWMDGPPVEHKVFKRYVVRGKGRAQPAHLKTKGKSRYGSRLRLRNAQRLLADVTERLSRWYADEPPKRLFVSAPVRMIADLNLAEPPPPVDLREIGIRVPLDVRTPCFDELKRVQTFLGRGRFRRWAKES